MVVKNAKRVELNTKAVKFVENLKNRFANTYNFSNHDINKFILLLRKGVYPHEYIDDWKKFSKT